MSETELENLVVRLTGDASGFINMLNDAQVKAQSFASRVSQILGVGLEIGGTGHLVNSFADFQDNLVRLETTLQANGLAVDETMNKYKKFTAGIEDTTRVSKVAATGLLSVAASYGLVGEKAEQATKMAIGIAQSRRGVAAESALHALSMFMRGNEMKEGMGGGTGSQFMGMMRLASLLGLPARGMGMGRGANAQQMADKMLKEVNKQLKIASEISEKLGKTFGGQLARIKNSLQDISVELGEIISKWLEPIIEWIHQLTFNFSELNVGTKRWIVGIMGVAAAIPLFGMLVSAIGLLSTFFTPMGVALTTIAGILVKVVHDAGGLAAVWPRIQRVASNAISSMQKQLKAFIIWAFPMWEAFKGVAAAVWEAIAGDAKSFSEWLKDVFDSTLRQISVDWKKMSDDIIDIFIGLEFAVRNFSKVWSYLTTSAAYYLAHIGNMIEFVFTTGLGTSLKNMAILVGMGFRAVGVIIRDVLIKAITTTIKNMAELTYMGFHYIGKIAWEAISNPEGVSKLIDRLHAEFARVTERMRNEAPHLGNVFTNLKKEFKDVMDDMEKNAPRFKPGPGEKVLKEDMDKQAEVLGKGYEKFHNIRRREIDRAAKDFKLPTFSLTKEGKEMEKLADNIDLSTPFKKAEKEIHKWEAELFGSAEAFTRWQEYLDKIDDNALEKATEKATEAVSKGESSAPKAVEGEVGGGAKAEQHGDKVEQLLDKILNRLNKTLNVRIENGAPSKIK